MYYAPVVAFLQRDGRPEDVARELAHDFFARLLEGSAISGADPLKGRFRNFLLGALKHFAAGQREHLSALKRGGGKVQEVLAADDFQTGAGLQLADEKTESPDVAFDRQWALTILERSLERLAQQMSEAGKTKHFVSLKPWLTGDSAATSQAQAAAALGMSEEAVKVAVHRLRKRFKEAVKAEISQTVADPANVREELEALMEVLRGRR